MKGVVMKSTGKLYQVLGDDQNSYTCSARGKLRLEHTKYSNPIAVGDHVLFEREGKEGRIEQLLPRENFIERKSVKKNTKSNMLAANISQILLMVTLKKPYTSTGLIDRILVVAESFRIPQLIIFNKNDILSVAEKERQDKLVRLYTAIGVDVEVVSIIFDKNLTCIDKRLAEKTTLITGPSGTGKSTLLNRIIPGTKQPVNEISNASKKGRHTTTYAEMFQKDRHTFVIDSPGLKEWGIVNMSKDEISDYFPEMRQRRANCKYGTRCTHTHEPECAVQVALARGEIAPSRHKSYVNLIEGRDSRK